MTYRANFPLGRPAFQAGFTLIEMMIAMTIGLIMSVAIAILFSQVSATNKEQFKAALQIENGRYATDLIGNDLRHAGYYGAFSALPQAAAALPDPCVGPAAGTVTSTTTGSPLAFYVQGYPAASLTTQATVPAGCQPWIDGSTLKPGTDILVIRRLDTSPLIAPTTSSPNPSATAVTGMAYAQTNDSSLDIQYGLGTSVDKTTDATGAATATAFSCKDYSQATSGVPPIRPLAACPIRRVHVHVYFVANCRNGSGLNGTCTSSDDTIPTLKRLELTASGGAATMSLSPLVDGIEFMKIYYGVDTDNNGQVDSTGLPQPATVADWQNVMQAEVRFLARNIEKSSYTDTNTYDLGGGLSYAPSGSNASYRRHAFDQQVYITNIGGRREQ